jgi:hypothetical protein
MSLNFQVTAYRWLEGYAFLELDPRFQRHIELQNYSMFVILMDTFTGKFDVFERLILLCSANSQELRHGIYYVTLLPYQSIGSYSDFSAHGEFRDNRG